MRKPCAEESTSESCWERCLVAGVLDLEHPLLAGRHPPVLEGVAPPHRPDAHLRDAVIRQQLPDLRLHICKRILHTRDNIVSVQNQSKTPYCSTNCG